MNLPAWNRELHPGTSRLLNVTLLAFVVGACLFWFWAYLEGSRLGADRPQLFSDAVRYLAAGERLNAGHELYALGPGDREVLTIPGVHDAPLLSPPPIAVVWRGIAVVPFGLAVWITAVWIATLVAVAVVVLRSPLPGVPLALALSLPIGEAIFGGNTVGIYPLFFVLAWRFRDHTWIGWLIAVMAADKLAAIAMASWLVATGRYRTVAVIAGGLLLAFVVGGVGAGFDAYVQWLEVLGTVGVSPLGLSGMTGISWASYAAFAGGIVMALALGRRSPRISYAVALTASVLGNPALYPGHLAPLIAAAAPLTDRSEQNTVPERDARTTKPIAGPLRWRFRSR